EYRPSNDKHFLITFNKNKGINSIEKFENELLNNGFRLNNSIQTTHRLYIKYRNKRFILELVKNHDNNYYSVHRILKYSTKFSHIDIVKSKTHTQYPSTYDDIYDIRISMGKIDGEELNLNDNSCNFLHKLDLINCVYETMNKNGSYVFNRQLTNYFDYFQVKTTRTYDYSCMNSDFFGVKIIIENQQGYDLDINSKTLMAHTPYIKTQNVILAKINDVKIDYDIDDIKRISMGKIDGEELNLNDNSCNFL
ncbi:unnamed protein product, partial [Didymodactylos carnosus]